MRVIFAVAALIISVPLMFQLILQLLTGGLRLEAHEAQTLPFSTVFVLAFLIAYCLWSAGAQLGLWSRLRDWIHRVSDYYAGEHDA